MKCGGTTPAKEANKEIQAIVNKVRDKAEKKNGSPYPEFEATHYKSQVVAGTNYFVKVKVDVGNYVHLRIFVPLPHEDKDPELSGVLGNKQELDELKYFDCC